VHIKHTSGSGQCRRYWHHESITVIYHYSIVYWLDIAIIIIISTYIGWSPCILHLAVYNIIH